MEEFGARAPLQRCDRGETLTVARYVVNQRALA